MAKLLGYTKGTSKAGNQYCRLYFIRKFSEREEFYGSKGCCAESVFTPFGYDIDKVNDSCIGKEFTISYEVINGKAQPTDIKFN